MNAEHHLELQKVREGGEAFNVTVIESKQMPTRAVLFAAGRGGSPLRHLPLLQSVAGLGCKIIAPHFEPLHSMIPTRAELETRSRWLASSVNRHLNSELMIVGIGHSIGTVNLLVLAGGEAETFAGEPIISKSHLKFERLALFAPPTDFFRRPGALKSVTVPIRVWAGAKDSITPPAQAQFLQQELKKQLSIEICFEEEAGHFTYMDDLPPNVSDTHPHRGQFLASLARDVGRFVITPANP